MRFFKLLTYLIGITNVFSQSTCDNCIDSQNRGENIDCTNICHGQETHLTDCLQYTRCLYDYDLHKVRNICVCQKVECEYEYVCPHSEILHYGDDNMYGYTVYEISLEIKNLNSNIYAIYGNSENNMIIPAAYQLKDHQGANIGGINPLLRQYIPDSKYDSWLTIGLTDGNSIGQVDVIGVDFNSWTDTNDLIVDNGAIFLDDPLEQISATKKYIIGHLTLNDRQDHRLIISANGKIDVRDSESDSYSETNIVFNFPKKISLH